MKIGIFEDAYNLCAKQLDKYPSRYFKDFIDNLFDKHSFDNPLRKAMITGYFLRLAESLMAEKQIDTVGHDVKKILISIDDIKKKIEAIANYFDSHNKIGLPKKISIYTLIPFNDINNFLDEYALDLLRVSLKKINLEKDKKDEFVEIIYRNMSFGYLFRLSEELVEIESRVFKK